MELRSDQNLQSTIFYLLSIKLDLDPLQFSVDLGRVPGACLNINLIVQMGVLNIHDPGARAHYMSNMISFLAAAAAQEVHLSIHSFVRLTWSLLELLSQLKMGLSSA